MHRALASSKERHVIVRGALAIIKTACQGRLAAVLARVSATGNYGMFTFSLTKGSPVQYEALNYFSLL